MDNRICLLVPFRAQWLLPQHPSVWWLRFLIVSVGSASANNATFFAIFAHCCRVTSASQGLMNISVASDALSWVLSEFSNGSPLMCPRNITVDGHDDGQWTYQSIRWTFYIITTVIIFLWLFGNNFLRHSADSDSKNYQPICFKLIDRIFSSPVIGLKLRTNPYKLQTARSISGRLAYKPFESNI